MKRPAPLLRIALLPVVLAAGFVAYGGLVALAGLLMPLPERGALVLAVLMSQGFLAATLMAALAAYPLGWLYRRRAPWVAGLMTLEVSVVDIPGLVDAGRPPLARFVSAWNLLALLMLLVGGSWLARRAGQGASAD